MLYNKKIVGVMYMNDKKLFELTGINVIEKIEFEAKEEK